MMICLRNGFILSVLLMAAACSSESNSVNMNEKKPSIVQKSVDKVIQPHINAINKAKALEGKLQAIEQDRLKSIEAFEQ